ncbi:magnesium-dependent phosphatase-1 [Stieleria sp. JC731]|uniref:magnesium-dependent phosphatase-1 n=1 Tax=Pirellulaceae TaxID=2691357 RepID=UPI001E418E61|nr:magnesium-dependent phosphatase-1 [Stieleria sp. JC731]MCC9602155.1 magnesium-dependent phosphatase-1 [Stieleria sp. JC731]
MTTPKNSTSHSPPLPKLIVFDLDFTLWDCGGTWCDCLTPPFRYSEQLPVDKHGRRVELYRDVAAILDFCDASAIPMALASRTEQPRWARELIGMLEIEHRFAYAEIYPSSKFRHFDALRHSSGIGYDDMLFFDDEMRNILDVSSLGVTAVHVPAGINAALFAQWVPSFGTA